MRRPRTVLIVAAAATMALASLGGPVAALDPDPQIAVVNGLPSINRIDICSNGTEVKSRLKYGRAFKLSLPGGSVSEVVVRKARAGTCRGRRLATFIGFLGPGDSVTLVFAKGGGNTRFFSFSNRVEVAVAATAADVAAGVAVHNVANAGTLDTYLAAMGNIAAVFPNAKLGKGDIYATLLAPGFYSAWGAKAGKFRPLIGPSLRSVAASKLRHFVFVGTTPRNYRVATFQTELVVG